MDTTRRDFIRKGALFVAAVAAGDLLWEPKRLWAFPTNPLAPSPAKSLHGLEGATYRRWGATESRPLTEAEVAAVIKAIAKRSDAYAPRNFTFMVDASVWGDLPPEVRPEAGLLWGTWGRPS